MFEIKNSSGTSIATVNYDELMALKAQGIIRLDDKIYDKSTGERVY